jgi:hypothetical protein
MNSAPTINTAIAGAPATITVQNGPGIAHEVQAAKPVLNQPASKNVNAPVNIPVKTIPQPAAEVVPIEVAMNAMGTVLAATGSVNSAINTIGSTTFAGELYMSNASMQPSFAIQKPLLPADRVPANWHILPTDKDGVVFAQNNQTGRTFTGSPKEFSKFIRAD